MFENGRVKAVAALLSRVSGPISVSVAPSLPLGGSACIAQLDASVIVSERPLRGNWTAHFQALDEHGLPQSQIVPTVLAQGVPEDLVVIHAMFTLAAMGAIQLRVRDGQIVPTDAAVSAKPAASQREWTEFIHRWKTAVAQVYFMSQGGLPCLPGNSASFGTTAKDLAVDVWPQLIEDDPWLFQVVLKGK